QGKKTVVSKAEREQLAEVHTVQVVEEDGELLTWNETEVLAAHDSPARKPSSSLRILAQLGMLAALLRGALGAMALLPGQGISKLRIRAAQLPL
ncbi:unnamed protein product, partial [Symbiodinium pilosum]